MLLEIKQAARYPFDILSKMIAARFSQEIGKLLSLQQTRDKQAQTLLVSQWRSALRMGAPIPDFREVEFGCYSQNGEDGILLLVFSVIGTSNKTAVEMCAGNGIE